MTQSARRIARYRDPKHSGRDPLDALVMASAVVIMTVINFAGFVPLLFALWPLRGEGLTFTAVLIIATLNLVIMRGVSVFGQHVLRRWIFDREQRRHEIVPLTEQRATHA